MQAQAAEISGYAGQFRCFPARTEPVPSGIWCARRANCQRADSWRAAHVQAWSAYRAGRGALRRDRRRTSKKDEHGPSGNREVGLQNPKRRF
jgi:hypothetical protein